MAVFVCFNEVQEEILSLKGSWECPFYDFMKFSCSGTDVMVELWEVNSDTSASIQTMLNQSVGEF